MSGAIVVAKKKADSKEKPTERPKWLDRPQKPVVAQVRGSVEFKEWLDRLCKQDRRPLSDLFEIAVADYAAKVGFEAPPER